MININKKEMFKLLSFSLIFIGIFIIIMQPFRGLTGAVIDVSDVASKVWFFVGLGMICGGVGVIVFRSKLEGIVSGEVKEISAEEVLSRIREIEPDANKVALISDTSAVLKRSPAEAKKILSAYQKSYAPDSVLDEIPYVPLRNAVEGNSDDLEGFERYRKPSKAYLERTEKPTMYRVLMPIFEELTIFGGKKELSELTPKDLQYISDNTERLKKLADRDKFDMRGRGLEGIKRTKEYLEEHCKISEADVDVLAMGLKNVRERNHAVIAQKDIDLSQAIDIIKAEHPKIGKNIDYVNLYPTEEEAVA